MSAIIHVGFQKCASTFLQKHIFPTLRERQYVHWEGEEEYAQLGSLYLSDIDKRSPVFNLADNDIFISREGFVASTLNLKFYKYGETKTKDIFFSNISVLFKKRGKLIFVIRRQDSLIASWIKFKPYLFPNSQSTFIDFPVNGKNFNDMRLANIHGRYYLEFLDYFNIIQRITTVLGSDRIHVIRYEDLFLNRKRFYADLSEACEEDLNHFANKDLESENVSEHMETLPSRLSPFHSEFQKLKGIPVVNQILKPFKSMFYRKRDNFFPSDVDELMQIYQDGNKRLSDLLDLDLNEYGYC